LARVTSGEAGAAAGEGDDQAAGIGKSGGAAKDEAATKLAAADFLTRVATGGSAAAKGFLARVSGGARATAGEGDDEAAGVGGSGGDGFVRAKTDASAQVHDGTRRGCRVVALSQSVSPTIFKLAC
jgi:hypothetical protein